MLDANAGSILARIERLERQHARLAAANRRLRRAVSLCALGAGALLFLAQATPQQKIEAEDIILRDAAGKARARLWVDAAGAKFGLWDAAGNNRIVLEVAEQGGAKVVLWDSKKVQRVLLHAPDDRASLAFWDAAGKNRLLLETEAAAARVVLRDVQGGQRAMVAAAETGPRLTFWDGAGKSRVLLEQSETSGASLGLWNAAGKMKVALSE